MAGQSQLDAVGCDVGASSPWERRAGPNSCRGGTQKRVSLGLHPVSLRKSKEMGWNGQLGPQSTAQENGAHAQRANEVPPCLWLCTCAPIHWVVVVRLSCRSTPFLWCLPKETVSSRQRKALFYLGGSTIRVSAAASVVFTHLRPTWGGAWRLTGRSSQLDAVGGDVGASSPWERRVGRNSSRGGFKSAFLWGSTPFLCARAKKWGGTGSRGQNPPPKKTAHTYKAPTPTSPSPKSGEERPVHRLVALTRMVEPPG